MVALSEVAVDIVASGGEARFRDLMEAHHYLGALPGNLAPKALQRFRVRRRDGQYRAPSLSAKRSCPDTGIIWHSTRPGG